MKNETRGGAGDAADNLEERLTRRFESELAQAERDYPNLSISRRTSAPAGGRASGANQMAAVSLGGSCRGRSGSGGAGRCGPSLAARADRGPAGLAGGAWR